MRKLPRASMKEGTHTQSPSVLAAWPVGWLAGAAAAPEPFVGRPQPSAAWDVARRTGRSLKMLGEGPLVAAPPAPAPLRGPRKGLRERRRRGGQPAEGLHAAHVADLDRRAAAPCSATDPPAHVAAPGPQELGGLAGGLAAGPGLCRPLGHGVAEPAWEPGEPLGGSRGRRSLPGLLPDR